MMEANIDAPKVSEARPGSKSGEQDDLKSLPLPEVEKRLKSSPDGLSQAKRRIGRPNTGRADQDWLQAEREIRKNESDK